MAAKKRNAPSFVEGERVHHVRERWDGTVLPGTPATPEGHVRVRSDGGYTGEYERRHFVRKAGA